MPKVLPQAERVFSRVGVLRLRRSIRCVFAQDDKVRLDCSLAANTSANTSTKHLNQTPQSNTSTKHLNQTPLPTPQPTPLRCHPEQSEAQPSAVEGPHARRRCQRPMEIFCHC